MPDPARRPLPCGHPVGCVASGKEGTSYCRWCEEVGRLRAALAEHEVVAAVHPSAHRATISPAAWDEMLALGFVPGTENPVGLLVRRVRESQGVPMPDYQVTRQPVGHAPAPSFSAPHGYTPTGSWEPFSATDNYVFWRRVVEPAARPVESPLVYLAERDDTPGVYATGLRIPVVTWLIGPARYESTEATAEVYPAEVVMPEGRYPATVKVYRCRWNRRFWRGRWWWRASVEVPVGVPIPGKGENSWDCDDHATFGVTTAVSRERPDVRAVVDAIAIDAMRDRQRRAGLDWVPPKTRPAPAPRTAPAPCAAATP